jgi:death-on-curing protein
MELLLEINGWALAVDDADCIATVEAVAAGTVTEADLVAWVRRQMVRSE